MFPDSEVLVGIATLGLTLTGFSGLVAIMGRRGSGRWTPGERFQFIQLAIVSLAVTFGAFVPILVSAAFADEISLRISSGIISAIHLGCMVQGLSTVTRSQDARTEYAPGVILFITSGGVLTIIAGFASAFSNLGFYDLTILLNLLWMLFVAVVNFIQLLTSSVNQDDA